MTASSRNIQIIVVVIFGIILQALLLKADSTDTPVKAVKEYATAYFCLDEAMAGRICEDSLTDDNDDNVVDSLIESKLTEARERGFKLSYLKKKLTHIKLEITENIIVDEEGTETAKIKLAGEGRPTLLRSFFTNINNIDESFEFEKEFELIRQKNGLWTVCGDVTIPLD